MWNKILEDFQAAVMIQEIWEIRHFFIIFQNNEILTEPGDVT